MIFEVSGLSFSYPGGDREILKDVGFSLDEGGILSILGPNGAGKSTLLNLMVGLLRPSAGKVTLNGKDISAMSERETARLVSYVPQNHYPVFGFTVEDFVLMGRAPLIPTFGRPRKADRGAAEKAMEDMGILHLAKKPYTDISGGERQQAAIARAIVREPKAILFDEPTAHLDFGNQLRVLRIVKRLSEKGYAVVMTSHNPDHAILLGGCTALLDKAGHLTAGDNCELLTEETLCRVYDADLRLRYVEELGRKACFYPKL